MKSIKTLIKISTLKSPILKKSKTIPAKLNWDNVELGLDDVSRLQINKINKWFQQSKEDLKKKNSGKEYEPVYKVLFYGRSAVAKTKVVKMIAKQNALDIYRVKLSEVLSKYIDETEKNLEKIFNEAESKNWILLFDEADALFGKRTDVKDAHDRYANLEFSFLLQKLENYTGIIIFNCKECDGSDKVLAKYFKTVVHFPTP